MSEQKVIANIIVNEELVREVAAEQVEAYLKKILPRIWYTRTDIKFMTQKKSDEWIKKNVDNHPYVKEHGLAFPDHDASNSPMNYTRGIIDFLDKFGFMRQNIK